LVERYQPRLVIIACNTACTIALNHVRAALDVPVVGTVPAIKPAAETSRTGVIGLLGTAATVRQAYVDELQSNHAQHMRLLRHAAPELVSAAEAKLRGEDVDSAIYTRAMAGLMDQPHGERLDVTVLGCTHFPLIKDELLAAAPYMRFVDAGIARRICHLTADQSWPEKPADGIFVTTGEIGALTSLRPALYSLGMTQIKAL
jgi:glutamate racemase